MSDVGDASAPAAPGARDPLAAPGDRSPGGDALRLAAARLAHAAPARPRASRRARPWRASAPPPSCLFLVDHDQRRMHPFGPDADAHDPVDIDTTVAGRAFAWERTQTAATARRACGCGCR